MKLIIKVIILSLFIYLLPINVSAGSLSFGNPEEVAYNKYKFSLIVKDIELNYLKGSIKVTNGTVTNVKTSSGWINKTGNNNSFYFYYDGIKKGEYLVATFEVTMSMTGDSKYSIENIDYGTYNCQKDIYGNYFGETGNIVTESTFNNTCGKSKDATLKSLSPSVGVLSPNFSSDNYYYALNVSNIVSSIVFDATPTNKYASVSGTKCILTSNVTDCNIKVTSEAGNTKTYNVTVFKENSLSSDSFMTNFKVHNGVLDKEFNINTTSYNLTPNKDAESIYFSFNLNGTNYTTKKCSSDSANCKVTVTSADIKRQYTFYILHDEDEERVNSTLNNEPTKTTTNQFFSTASSNKKTSKTTTKSNKETTKTIKEAEEKDETIDPVEYNKENNSKNEKEENNETTKEIVVEEKVINKNEDKNKFLKILCVVNVFLGICIGLFFKKKVNKN